MGASWAEDGGETVPRYGNPAAFQCTRVVPKGGPA